VDYRADFGVGLRATHVEGPWTSTELRTLSVGPRLLGTMVPVRLALAPNVPDDLTELHVDVRYQNAAAGIDDGTKVTLGPSQREATVNLRLAAVGDPVFFTPTVFYTDGGTENLDALVLPNSQSEGALVVGVPKADRVDGDLLLVDALGEIISVIVDLEVSQAGAVIDNKSIQVTGAASRVPWSVRLPDRTKPAAVRWRQRISYRDGGLETGEWTVAPTPAIVVGIPAEGVMTVQVRYVGGPPSTLGLAGVVVELAYTDPGGDATFAQRDSLFVDDTPQSHLQEWRVRLADRDAHQYSWSVTSLKADGSQVSTPAQTSDSDQLFVHMASTTVTDAPTPPAPPEPPIPPEPTPTPPAPTPTPPAPGP
jgi:hypothetical protein